MIECKRKKGETTAEGERSFDMQRGLTFYISSLLPLYSIRRATSAPTMDDPIIITTSDKTPATMTVSRSALAVNSQVFADMLSVPRRRDDNSTPSIAVTETEAEFKQFLVMLVGSEASREEAMKGLSEQEWETIARLGDKYDSWVIRKLVEAKAW